MDHQTQQHHDRMVLVGVGEAWLAMLCWTGLLGAALMALGRLLHRHHPSKG
ncbi:MAG: hypothetical protein OHK0022_21150 [Roseiflexaceae bacterium]